MIPSSVTLLGSGYTGHALMPLLTERGVKLTHTRRPGSLSQAGNSPAIPFELTERATWQNLPESTALVWVFPAEPANLVRQFLTEVGTLPRKIVVVGTTSSYLQQEEDDLVSEESSVDHHQGRVQGEEVLMGEGAVVLRSAGIYGPALGQLKARNPLDWLRAGMIASPETYLNLIHVRDLASTILTALESDVSGEHFIVSDGAPRRWKEIEAWALERGLVREVHYTGRPARRPSRRLSNRKLLYDLAPQLQHTDLYAELAVLESP